MCLEPHQAQVQNDGCGPSLPEAQLLPVATTPRRAGGTFCSVHYYGDSCVRIQTGQLESKFVSFIPPSRHIQEPDAESCLNRLPEGSLGPRHTTNWARLSRRVVWAGSRENKNLEAEPPSTDRDGEEVRSRWRGQ